jgi:hypothetical protein
MVKTRTKYNPVKSQKKAKHEKDKSNKIDEET